MLYSFTVGSDGYNPDAGLLNVNGVLYGTTIGGGANDFGTVFSITTAGVESVVYSFAGNLAGRGGGANPAAALINVSGVLYGTTYDGGVNGLGTVFSFPL